MLQPFEYLRVHARSNTSSMNAGIVVDTDNPLAHHHHQHLSMLRGVTRAGTLFSVSSSNHILNLYPGPAFSLCGASPIAGSGCC
jgi:hypothetical protein